MPVEILVNNREFKNQYDNGDTFATNPAEFTVNLAGSVMEKIQVLHQIDVRWFFQASTSNPVDYENLGADLFRFKKANTGDFVSDGFSINDGIDWQFETGGTTFLRSGTVTNISPTWMYIQFATSTTIASGQSTSTLFQGTSDLTAVLYNFGLIQNTESFNTLSKTSGNAQAYYAAGITEGGGSVAMVKQFQYEDWVTGSASIERLTNPSTYTQRFEVTHEFIINPYYLDGQLTNLENDVVPGLLAGLNSLKYVFEIDARTALSNPNSSKIAREQQQLGSVAWFNENFNGFNNIYSLGLPAYEDATTAATADGLLIKEKTKVSITVAKSTGSFVSTDKIGVYVSYLPPSSNYINVLTDLQANFMYGNAHALADGAAGTFAGVVTRVEANLNAGDIDIDFDVDYSAAQQLTLDSAFNAGNEPRFIFAIQVGDVTIAAGDSDKVLLLGDVEKYDANADITGLFDITTNDVYKHNKTVDVDAPASAFIGWNEDGLTWKNTFELDLNLGAVLNTLNFVVVAYNSVTDQYFLLQNFTIPGVAGAPTYPDSGFTVQSLEFTGDRGYLLATGSQFNSVILTTGTLTAGVQSYTLEIGFKTPWQDWLSNAGADTVFFDSTKLNNNLNFKSSNYSGEENYNIHVGLLANLTGVNTLGNTGLTDYLIQTPSNTVNDYALPAETWAGTIETYDSTGTTFLGTAILPTEDTWVKIYWNNFTGDVYNLAGFWAIHRIEESQQGGYAIEEISTIRPFPAAQILKPLVGETQLKISIVGGDILTECLIDYTKLVPGVDYDISGRLEGDLGWLPTSIDECSLWLDYSIGTFSDKGITPAVLNDTIEQWNDQSGAGNDFNQFTLSRKPKLRAGHIEFDGVNDHMSRASASFVKGNSPFSMMAVLEFGNVSGTEVLYARWIDAGNQRSFKIERSGTTVSFHISDDGINDVSASSAVTVTTGQRYLISAYHDSGTDTIGIAVDLETFVTSAHSTGAFAGSTAEMELGTGDIGVGAAEINARQFMFWSSVIDATDQIDAYNALVL